MRIFINDFRMMNFLSVLDGVGHALWAILSKLGLFLIGFYRLIIAPFLTGSCRFYPSCSEYACGCLREHRFDRAIFLVIRRLGSCRPGGAQGFDPVPPRISK